MNPFGKKDGYATIPLCGMLIVFLIIMVIIFICYQESERACYITDDAVTISIQGVCLFDRYEYATGSQNGKENVCFYPGDANIKYGSTDAENIVATKSACAYAYAKYLNVLFSNISTEYVIVPAGSVGGIANYVKKFVMTNVYDDTAYVYDIISNTTNIIKPATGLKSILTVEMEIDMDFPLYGQKTIGIKKNGKLENQLN